MNGVKNETHVRVEQTARGIWYCSGVDVYGENSSVLRQELETNMILVEDILAKHNNPQQTDEQHTDLKVGFVPLEGPRKVRK
jgi:hypothetical protein